ncbi:MAG: NnrS family protein [Myxococcaceae bacterium]
MTAPVSLHLAPMEGVAPWQRNPYRVLFPVGVALAFAGVGQWLLFAAQLGRYRPIFHAMTQVQGFVMCFVSGFLLTFIPRRTGAAPPSLVQLLIAALSPIALAITAWEDQWALSQVFYLSQVVLLLYFVGSRLLRSRLTRPPDDHLVWVPLSLVCGIAASVLTGVAAARGAMWLHDIGRRLVLEAVVSGLVLGVGSFLVPVITRGQPPTRAPSLRGKLLQVALFSAFIGTYFVEGLVSDRLGLGVRAAIAVYSLVAGAQLWRRPTRPGLNAWLVWLGAWTLPFGLALAAAFPVYRNGLMHIVYLGTFGVMALSVGTHVVLAHANQMSLLSRAPLPLIGLAALAVISVTARVLLAIEPGHYFLWMTLAASAFLAAGALWLVQAWRYLSPFTE